MPARVILEGVLVQNSGAGGYWDTWAVTLDCKPWRIAGGAWDARQLRVHIPMAKQAANRLFAKWRRGEAIRVSAAAPERVIGRNVTARVMARGVLPVRRIRVDATAKAPAPATTLVAPVLGTLRFDAAMGWYGARRGRRPGRHEVAIRVRVDDPHARLERAVARGAAIIVAIERALATYATAAAKKLVATYNASWRGNRPRLTAAALARTLRLTSIIVDAAGRASVLLDASDRFADHAIELRVTRGRVTQTALAG
jgi:hypothetical protein